MKQLLADPDAIVRVEAARALGQTDGSESALLARFPIEEDEAVRIEILEGLGRQGGKNAIPALIEALRTRPPTLQRPVMARTAAFSLGRLALREVEGVRDPEVVDALLDQQARLDEDLRMGAAYALARMKLDGLKDAATRDRLLKWAASEPNPDAQAFLVRATGDLDETLSLYRLYERTAADPDAGVRVATARASGPSGWTGVEILLKDPDPGVRREAMAALGKMGGIDRAALLQPIIDAGATLEAAEAAAAAGDPRLLDAAAALSAMATNGLVEDPAPYLESARPTEIRVAALDAVKDRAVWARLAAEDGEPSVRSGAASLLFAHEDLVADDVLPLLDAFDPLVAAMAAEWIARFPRMSVEGKLLALLEETDSPDLVREALRALTAIYKGPKPVARLPDTPLAPFVEPFYSHPDGTVRAAAFELADVLDLETPDPWHVLVTAPLDEVRKIRTARVKTTRGELIIQLLPEEAPITVWNFAKLADQGFYDNLRIHRVVPDFVVQDGDPRGDGSGGPGWTIPDEINDLHYDEGMVGMALSGPDTGGSQWFITLSPQPHLDGTYTIFGKVLRGMHVVHALQQTDRILRIEIERTELPSPHRLHAQR